MANKFTKSVLERQAKEWKTQNTATENVNPDKKIISVADQINPVVSDNIAMQSTKQEQVKPPKTGSFTSVAPNLAGYLVKEEERFAKNKTFYLDGAVIDALHCAAVSQKVTDSKLLNDVLKKILGNL